MFLPLACEAGAAGDYLSGLYTMPNREETLFLEQAEQRRYRRLEVSLPVWLAEEADFERPGNTAWSLGYTRDISLGGAKVYVPDGEETHWRDASKRDATCLVRYDVPGCSLVEYIVCRIKHAAREKDTGRFWLGIEYEPGSSEEKSAVMRAGLRTMRSRRRLWGALAVAAVGLVVAGFTITHLNAANAAQQKRIAQLSSSITAERTRLSDLSLARLVGTRAEGIDSSFQRKEVQAKLRQLTVQMQRLNDPKYQSQAEQLRAQQQIALGLNSVANATANSVVNLGVALPYGYAWPQVTGVVEQELGRGVPTVVVFRDFTSQFPMADCSEARLRAKTLQITWEPWHFDDPKAISLQDIIKGKYDSYIDGWANSARSFGGELWIRWGHEFNGNWYPWSIAANKESAATYVAAYRHVHDRFTHAGAFNVRWVWCMNAETVPNTGWNDPLRAYPGDDYVDNISIDGYNFGTALSHSHWETFAEIFAIPYSRVAKRFPNKPISVGETGCATVGGPTGNGGADKAKWVHDMDRALRGIFPRITGVVWFQAEKEAKWQMDSSPESLQASRQVWGQNYYRRGET